MSNSTKNESESTMESVGRLGVDPIVLSQISSLTNQLAGLRGIPRYTYTIDPLKDLEKISENTEAIILFELLPIENLDGLNKFCKEKFGNELLQIEDRLARNVCQTRAGSLDCDMKVSKHIKRTKLCASYSFGNFIQLIFICELDLSEFNKEITGTVEEKILKRNKRINEIQIEIESNILPVFYGLFFNNNLQSFKKPFALPSLLIFNTYSYSHFLDERENVGLLDFSTGFQTIRDRADSFLTQFKENKIEDKSKNYIETIGIDPIFLTGTIDKKIIVSVDNLYFEHKLGRFYCRFVALHFENPVQIFDKEGIFINFVYDLSLSISIEAVLTKLRIGLEDFHLDEVINAENEIELKFLKKGIFSSKNQLGKLEEEFLTYKTGIKDAEEKHVLGFMKEESWKRGIGIGIGTGKDARSISDYFKQQRDSLIEKLSTSIEHSKKKIEEKMEFTNMELQLIKDKPAINSFLKDIESELITQITKWKGKIEQKEIEEWLLNFETTDDRKNALKILDKMSYVSYDDIRSLCKALYHRIEYCLDSKIEKCVFSYIGHITSGSAHILKIFQEENKISETKFVTIDKLPHPTEKIPLILLDDFIGSGKTFTKWFEKDKNAESIKNEKYEIYYGVLTAFEKGVKVIEEKVPVIFGYLYEQSRRAKDGTVFDGSDKEKITQLVDKYSSKFPSDFVWGYDDCQLLVSFEGNIPNNSIALLWWEKGWTPLLKRK